MKHRSPTIAPEDRATLRSDPSADAAEGPGGFHRPEKLRKVFHRLMRSFSFFC
jgi:hypothetical protein